MNILLTVILVVSMIQTGLILWALLRAREAARQFKDFISPRPNNEPSPLATTSQVLADMLSRSIVASIKATFMGKQSADARQTSMIESAVNTDLAGGSPLASVLTSFPAVAKALRKNPGLLDIALSVLQKRGITGGQSNQTVTSGNNGHNSQVKFNL